jgi:hypothetical protein
MVQEIPERTDGRTAPTQGRLQARFLTDVVTKWTDTHRSLVRPEPSGWNVSGP